MDKRRRWSPGKVPGSRPKDRRAQIVSAAAELFWRYGYDGVTVADIGAAVGISAGALYRHFPDKLTLLNEPIREMVVAGYAAALVAGDGGVTARDRLDRMVASVVEVAVDRPAVVGLWHREARRLSPDLRSELVGIRARTIALWAEQLTAANCSAHLDSEDAEFRIRAALGLLNSVPLVRHGVSRANLLTHLGRMVSAVLLATTESPIAGAKAAAAQSPVEVDRRSQILAAGVRLFRRHGYHRVGIDDIAEAAGIRGPSVYVYFRTKADVLFNLLNDMADRLDLALRIDLGAAEPDDTILKELVGRFVALVLRNRDLAAVYATELQHLPPDKFNILHNRRRARVRRWIALVCATHPEMTERMARVSVLATLEMVFAVARSHRYEDRVDLEIQLAQLAWASLTALAPDPARR